MPCDIQTLFDDNACLYSAPTFFLDVAIASAWCGVNGSVAPVGPEGQWWDPGVGGWSNPDVSDEPIVNPDA